MTHEPPDNTDAPTPLVNFDPPDEETRADADELAPSPPLAENAAVTVVDPPSTWFMQTVFPGLEAVMWMVGTLIAMVSGAIAAVLVVSFFVVVTNPGSKFSPATIEQQAMLPAIIGSQVFLLCFAALGVFVRFGPRFPLSLGLRRLPIGHFLLVLGLTLPVQFLAHAWSTLANGMLESIGISISSQEYMEQMEQILGAGPIAVMWFLMAVCPALGEELIFRGLIGNTLVRNWGACWGVLATSVLFGVIHIIPVQAIAVIPLGMAMHYVYLMTKSFWAPVLLHLANNSLALLMMASAGELSEAEAQSLEEPLSAGILIASLLTAACLLGILWQTRRRPAELSAGEADELTTSAAEIDGAARPAYSPTMLTYLAAALSMVGIGLLAYWGFIAE